MNKTLLNKTSYSFRSSRLQMIFKVAARKNLANLIGKHLWWSSLSLKLETVNLPVKNSIKDFSQVNFDISLWEFTSILKAITVLFLLHFDSCPAKPIIIWLTKQINTLSNKSFRGVFAKLFTQKKSEVSWKMLAVKSCLNNVPTFLKQDSDMGFFLESFHFRAAIL